MIARFAFVLIAGLSTACSAAAPNAGGFPDADHEWGRVSLADGAFSVAMPCATDDIERKAEPHLDEAACWRHGSYGGYLAQLESSGAGDEGTTLFDRELTSHNEDMTDMGKGPILPTLIDGLRAFQTWDSSIEPTKWQVIELGPDRVVKLMVDGAPDKADEVALRAERFFSTLEIERR